MNELLVALSIIAVVAGILYMVRHDSFVPPLVDDDIPYVIDGIAIGKYYGDPENKTCVEVIQVENGVVAFRHLDADINSMPKEAFLEKFYKYPNGCDFPEIGDNIEK